VFIDDSPRNVEAGSNAGLHALHFTGPQQLRTELMRFGLI
jgi:beta-phosphoglucomutase-like phosphatase (HAD superfamily)